LPENTSRAQLASIDSQNGPAEIWLGLSRSKSIFEDQDLTFAVERALCYVNAGASLHLSGSAGLGKTSLALYVAEKRGRPVSFMSGNAWLTARDFIGREVGQSARTVVDKYVQSVRRTETRTRGDWKEAILALSMRHGYTLVYDEFTRASPEANSTLLSVLEEGVLVSADRGSPEPYIEAHPDFRIILTSNPHDYVGVNGAPDALMDRLLTLELPPPSPERLAGIVAHRSGLDEETSARIAQLVSTSMRTDDPSKSSPIRSAILIARIVAYKIASQSFGDGDLHEIARDVLQGRGLTPNFEAARTFGASARPPFKESA
jgi:gas vesicle protein GvpN